MAMQRRWTKEEARDKAYELTKHEHGTKVAEAQRQNWKERDEQINSCRETCIICGMVANVDPSFHHSRYGHLPEVRRDGQVCRFDYHYYAFRPVKSGVR